MILDTSFLLDLKDGRPDAFRKATELYDEGTVQRVTIPSVWELFYGAAFTGSVEERRRVENLLMMYPLADLDENTARRAAILLADADRRAGGDSGVDTEDALIAAVADGFDEPVLTDNVDDFDKLDGIGVRPY